VAARRREVRALRRPALPSCVDGRTQSGEARCSVVIRPSLSSSTRLVGCAMALAVGAFAPALPAQTHGFVEPCAIPFVQDQTMTCQECQPTTDDPQYCVNSLGAEGYEKKCHSRPGHSIPNEVWCKPRERTASAAPSSDGQSSDMTPQLKLALVVALSGLCGAGVFRASRRGRNKTRN